MKLVLATPLYPPESGGPATYAGLLMQHLPAAGDEVELVKFSDVRHLPTGIRHISYYFRVLRAAQRADAVLALDPASVGFPALLAARMAGKPFVVKIVGDFAWEQGRQRFGVTESLDAFVYRKKLPFSVAYMRWVETYVARHATQVIVPSEYLKRIVTAWGIAPEKIAVIYNSVEVPELGNDVPHVAHQVITVGRLVPWKGMDALIDAMEQVRAEVPDATLVIVGEGPERELLERKGMSALGTSISFTGALSHTEVLRAIRAADVFVLNSSYEGLSHLVIEALAVGAAAVVSDAGGNPEIVQNDVTGVVLKTGDTDALAKAIVRLLKEEETRARLAARAKESATRFSVSIMIERTRLLLMYLTPHTADTPAT